MSDDEYDDTHDSLRTDDYDFFGKHHMVETTALRRKLQSKGEALHILRQEVEKFRTERDQFKLMAETLQLRYSAMKRHSDLSAFGLDTTKTSVASILHDTRERNIKLTTQIEALKQKVNELQGDIDLLRARDIRTEKGHNNRQLEHCKIETKIKEEQQWKQERANFICHLENLKKKNAQLAFDFKALIDEKEEIITERDAYKCKAHRLNHELVIALKANETHPKFLDIDGIILENKYLHERLKNFESEMELTKQALNRYKTMLETKRKKGIIKLGTNSNEESILSHKQVKNLLESGIDLPTKTETIQDLKSLCLALLDNLNDKNLALSHQKKTNKILAAKIAELEQRVQLLSGMDTNSSCKSGYAPSQFLLHGYCASMVDSSCETNETISTATTIKSLPNGNADTGTMSSDQDDIVNKTTQHLGICSDDGMSSLSTESGHSILSSEYGAEGNNIHACSLSEFANTAMCAYKTPSTTTDSGNCGFKKPKKTVLIPNSIVKERMNDLKDLPPELAAMVQKALHELDMRDFDEVVGACEGIGEEAQEHLSVDKDDDDDEATVH